MVQLLLARAIPLPFILSGSALLLGVTAEISSLHARLLPASLIAAIFTLSPGGQYAHLGAAADLRLRHAVVRRV